MCLCLWCIKLWHIAKDKIYTQTNKIRWSAMWGPNERTNKQTKHREREWTVIILGHVWTLDINEWNLKNVLALLTLLYYLFNGKVYAHTHIDGWIVENVLLHQLNRYTSPMPSNIHRTTEEYAMCECSSSKNKWRMEHDVRKLVQ